MPATQITINPVVGPFPTLPVGAGSLDLVFTAADVANGNFYTADPTVVKLGSVVAGGDIILVWNTDTNPHTVTFTSQPDAQGRSGDIAAYSVGAGVISALRVSDLTGWADNSGNVFLSASDATVKFAILRR